MPVIGKAASVAAVHLLTASGAVCGLFALNASAAGDWRAAFSWLGAALVIDAIDGPLARRVGAEAHLPRFSGARLDIVVDYLNYCAVPAFMLMRSGLLTGPLAAAASIAIVLSSLFHFADRQSKTADGYFVGFPAIWNVVCLYFFVLEVEGLAVLASVLVLAALTFVPIKWVHPVRVRAMRPLTLGVTAAWSIAALIAVVQGFPASDGVRLVFVLAAVYIVAVGVVRTLRSVTRTEDAAPRS